MTNKNAGPDYLAFLIRLWREDKGIWRCTLENPHTGERLAFADVAALLTYVQKQTDGPTSDIEGDWLL
ncbi:MAG: hypothetical protein CL608_25720 [Anaerolineaceae bacterium]|nr:hypothetical protein [Anaerolineaceae bacterium]